MKYPKYFFSSLLDRLYVITSSTEGYSLESPGKRGVVTNWNVQDMKELGNKPATVAQIRCFIPDYQPAPRKVAKAAPKITPFPPQLTLPEGYVYLGKGGEFKRPEGKGFRGDFAEVYDGYVTRRFGGEDSVSGEQDNFYYIAKIGSPVALLNGHTPKSSALKTTLSKLAASEARCAALTEENLRLKAIIAASKKELEKA